jgi:hypothetical protein
MANEIIISAVQGLSVTITLYANGVQVGSPFNANEIGATGEYIASMPLNTPYGRYLAIANVGIDVKIASGEILWGGTEEVEVEYFKILGLDPNNPSTTTQTNWDAGNVHIDITGDGVNTTTMTRIP